MRSRIGALAVVAAVVTLVDQATKTLAERRFQLHPVALGPVHLVYVLNSGVAFSIGIGHPLVAGVMAAVVAALLAAWGMTRPARVSRFAAGLVVGGALSNLLDRLVRDHHGAVIDWIQLPFWPVFNVADAAITVGIVAIILAEVRVPRG